MHRTDGSGHVGGLYTDGQPGDTEATVITDDWLNAVQTEVENVILASGASLSKPDNTQLRTALYALFGRLATAGTWSALQTFNGPAGDTNGALATTAIPTNFKLLWNFAIGADRSGRLYSTPGVGQGLVLTANASWNGTNWTPDANGFAAQIRLTDAGIMFRARSGVVAATPFADNTFTDGPQLTTSGVLPVANPASTLSVQDTLTKVNTPKAWAVIDLVPGNGGGSFTVSVVDGFNITSVARQSAGLVRVTFGADFSSEDYCLGGTWQRAAVAPFSGVLWKDDAGSTAGILDLGVINTATDVAIDFDALASGTTRIHLQVYGRQS